MEAKFLRVPLSMSTAYVDLTSVVSVFWENDTMFLNTSDGRSIGPCTNEPAAVQVRAWLDSHRLDQRVSPLPSHQVHIPGDQYDSAYQDLDAKRQPARG